MILTRTYDKDAIKSIMLELWDFVAEDGVSKDRFDPEVNSEVWLLAHDEDKIIGCFNFHALGVCTLQIHAQILPEYRKEYSEKAGRAALEFFYSTGYNRLFAEVPEIYPNVKRFCEKMGMTQESISYGSYMKNGEIINQHVMVILREALCQK